MDETPYRRPPGYAHHYRDRRFQTGHGPATDRRERAALARLLSSSPCSAGPWLDVPAGTGRLSGLLPGPAVQVDRSRDMLLAAGPRWPRICASAASLPFRDRSFAGALCLRLLQHLPAAPERVQVLRELARVTEGPVIVSFFDACSLQHLRRRLRRALGKPPSGRSALLRSAFRADLQAAGLRPTRWLPLRRLLAEQTLVLCHRY